MTQTPHITEIALVAALWLLGFGLLARSRLVGRPPRRAEAGPEPRPTSVSVVIPARDEARGLPPLLRSLLRQHPPPLEVIVVDDQSSDDTAAVALAHGARVIAAPPRPAGFAGKTWACTVGARLARGEVLVFLDADTRLEPGGLGRLVGEQQRRGGMVTVEPHHRTELPHEQISSFFNIARVAGVGAFGLFSPRARRSAAFGPCLVVDREAYQRTGGHAHTLVRGKVLETVTLGRVFARLGLPVWCALGRGVVWFRMYPGGTAELVHGWAKAAASGAAASPGATAALVAWVSAASWTSLRLAAALVAAATGSAGAGVEALWPWVAMHALFALQVGWMLGRVGRFRRATAWLFPLPLAAFAAIFALSLYQVTLRRRVVWKGRTVPVEG